MAGQASGGLVLKTFAKISFISYNGRVGKNITIRDIAREAGVSISTVSRVLTGSANVKDAKKKEILRIIEKYDFQPNMLARSLIRTQTMQIGYIVADICNPYYSAVFASCEKSANARGYTLLMMDSFSEQKKEIELLEKLERHQVDAIIMLGGSVDSNQPQTEFKEKLRSVNSRIPVIITGTMDGVDCPRVEINGEAAMQKLMTYLNGCGYKKLAFAGGKNEVSFTAWRRRAFKAELERYALPYYAQFDRPSDYDIDSGYTAACEILNGQEKPDAIIAINDFVAVGILKSLTEHGMKVPDDIGLVSFDNTYIATLLTPNLTSVAYDYDAFGEKIISLAIDRIEGRGTPGISYIDSEVVIRNSCRSLQ